MGRAVTLSGSVVSPRAARWHNNATTNDVGDEDNDKAEAMAAHGDGAMLPTRYGMSRGVVDALPRGTTLQCGG